MTVVLYWDAILNLYVHPCLAAMGPDAMFMNNNAQVHTAHIVNQYKEWETLLQMK